MERREMALLEINVNGREYQLVVDATTSLLTVLREHLHITGPKIGCETGDCGACSVLVNGKLRSRFSVETDADDDRIRELALADERVKPFVGDKPIKKVIVVKKKLVNIVV